VLDLAPNDVFDNGVADANISKLMIRELRTLARRPSFRNQALIFSEVVSRVIISSPFPVPRATEQPQAIRGRVARRPHEVLGKSLSEGSLEEGFIARAPELIGGANGLRSRIVTDVSDGKRKRIRQQSLGHGSS
jgi:hypothetical protein